MKKLKYARSPILSPSSSLFVPLLPGLGTAMIVVLLAALLARVIAGALLQQEHLLNPILLAIVLGLLVRNVLGLSSSVEPGLRFGLLGPTHALWSAFCGSVNALGNSLIAVAVSCTGLNTTLPRVVRLGWRPFLCGFIAVFSVGIVSWLLIVGFGQHL